MKHIQPISALCLIGFLAFLTGCGSDGPLGNNAPQGRPEWMKKDNTPPPPAPQKQE